LSFSPNAEFLLAETSEICEDLFRAKSFPIDYLSPAHTHALASSRRSVHITMAAMMSAAAVSARVAPAASGKKMTGAMRVVAEVEEAIVKIGTRGRCVLP
jgi:hypothetical protein